MDNEKWKQDERGNNMISLRTTTLLITNCSLLIDMAYQVCDGFTTNLGYFTIHPNVGGVFQNQNEGHDHKKELGMRSEELGIKRDWYHAPIF